jgi:hypothetical protein
MIVEVTWAVWFVDVCFLVVLLMMAVVGGLTAQPKVRDDVAVSR